jgi:hypothetical protein
MKAPPSIAFLTYKGAVMHPQWKDTNIKMDINKRTLLALNDPENWNGLCLPLIKRVKTEVLGKQTGVAIESMVSSRFIIYRYANMFADPTTWKGRGILTAEEIVAEGWEVD